MYLTAPEAATAARKHPVTVRKALEAGQLHGFQTGKGGRWSIKPDCLEAWIECRRCDHHRSAITSAGDRRDDTEPHMTEGSALARSSRADKSRSEL